MGWLLALLKLSISVKETSRIFLIKHLPRARLHFICHSWMFDIFWKNTLKFQTFYDMKLGKRKKKDKAWLEWNVPAAPYMAPLRQSIKIKMKIKTKIKIKINLKIKIKLDFEWNVTAAPVLPAKPLRQSIKIRPKRPRCFHDHNLHAFPDEYGHDYDHIFGEAAWR